ncbi:MAG: TlyA family RNA methyltransferase [Pseudomonadota bacterium]
MASNTSKIRLDQYLVDNHFAASRSRARDAILRGLVRVNGAVATKPGLSINGSETVRFDDPSSAYVSRAALKLVHGLEKSGFDVADKHCLDIGASTGGFSQVLLQHGAMSVVALDVGHGQLHSTIRKDERVTVLENTNARALTVDLLGGKPLQFIVSDVSFISLKLALPPAFQLAEAGSQCVLLVKPQFEVGRGKIGKNGIVSEEDAAASSADLYDWLDYQAGWRSIGIDRSPIKGGDGNTEFLLWGEKSL